MTNERRYSDEFIRHVHCPGCSHYPADLIFDTQISEIYKGSDRSLIRRDMLIVKSVSCEACADSYDVTFLSRAEDA